MEETNSELTNEVAHLQASVDEIHAPTTYFHENDDKMFDEYQTLKEARDSLLL